MLNEGREALQGFGEGPLVLFVRGIAADQNLVIEMVRIEKRQDLLCEVLDELGRLVTDGDDDG
jgi:hypothetical protein